MKKFLDESWLVLVMGVVFAAMLAGTQTSLQARIDDNRAKELNVAIAEVVPNVITKEEIKIDGIDDKKNKVYRCVDESGVLVGWAVEATGAGFIDKIKVVVGLSPDGGTISGIKAIEHLETPGLGNKIDAGNPFPEQFAGKSTALPLAVIKATPNQPNEIEAITGATYSSTYVVDIVNDVMVRIVPKLEK